MWKRTHMPALAGMCTVALLAAGCSGGSADPQDGSGGAITVRGCNPERPLIGADTNENCGTNILDLTVAKLVHYNADTDAAELDIAESITTKDNQVFTIALKKDYLFSDGTPVLAKHFVDAWNFSVANGYRNVDFFTPIRGYKELAEATKAAKQGGKTGGSRLTTMSGLRVIDDHTFEITTVHKVSNLVTRLGAGPFAPLPDAFFKDPKAFGQRPVGAGPYQVDAWNVNQDIRLTKNPHYAGAFGGKIDHITFKMVPNPDTAYNEVVANNLDATDEIPLTAMADDKYKQDLAGRSADRQTGGLQTLMFPPAATDPVYANPKLRQAISMAIDRDLITTKIFNQARTPADGWVSPVVDGYKKDQCGEYCKHNPTRAKELYDEAGGVPGGKITIAYNADAAHRDWIEATCNSIKNALGAECVPTPVTDFSAFRAMISAHTMRSVFRSSWVMDYPSIENFLAPLFATGGSANDAQYSNPAFDQKLQEAAAADTLEKANALYQEAEVMLRDAMPAIPLWYNKMNFAWSDRIENVKGTARSTIDYTSVTLK